MMKIVFCYCLIVFFLDYIMAKTHLSDGARGEMVTTVDIVICIIGILYVLFNASIVLYLALKFQSNEDRAELLIASTTRVVPELMNDGSTPSNDEQTNREKSISMTNQERRRLFLALSNLENRRITAIPEGRREHDHSDDEDEEDDEDEDIERNMFDQHVNDCKTNLLRHLVRDKRNLGDSKTRIYDLSNGVTEIAIYESIGLSSLLEEDEPPDISLPPETDFEYNNSPLVGEFQSSLFRK